MFEWDKSKAKKNLLNITIGIDAFGRILVVVYTWRGDNIRIISARKAVRSEVKQYESEI